VDNAQRLPSPGAILDDGRRSPMTDGLEHDEQSDLALAEERLRGMGARKFQTIEEMAMPGLFESEEELREFIADIYADRRRGYE